MTSEGDGTGRVCALPGCDNLLPAPVDPTKRYCCPEHRRAARRHRRGTTTTQTGGENTRGIAGTVPVAATCRDRQVGADQETDEPSKVGTSKVGTEPAAEESSDPATGPIRVPPSPVGNPNTDTVTQPLRIIPGSVDNAHPGIATQSSATARGRAKAKAKAEAKAERQAQRREEREEAAAVLAGRPLPGEEPPPTDRRGRRRRRLATAERPRLVTVPELVSSTAWVGQTREALTAAVYSLGNNRLRSLLTTVGIIAGVAAVIVLVAMGDGMTHQFQTEADKVSNQINITPAKGTVPDGGAPRNLTDSDAAALSDTSRAPHIVEISPLMSGTVAVTERQAKDKADMFGVQENYLRLADRHIVAGRWFSQAQITGGERGVVIGPQAVNLLFGPKTNPHTIIGLPIRLSHSSFTIQGVVDSNGQSDNVVVVPFAAARAYLTGNNAGEVDNIIVKSTNINTVPAAVSEIVNILDEQHHIQNAVDRDYNVNTYTDSIKKNEDFIHYLTLFTIAIATVSLFIGGVGVANIMLVSVTERTREIGIRKAVGAKTTAILRQFLSEAVMLTSLGGLGGIGFGIGITKIAATVLPHYGAGDPTSNIPIPILTTEPILTAFAISLLIGLAAGSYPAHRAARMRPIQALHFE